MSDVGRPTADASLGELFSKLTSDLSGLVRDEVQLAKVELKDYGECNSRCLEDEESLTHERGE